jgi:hypothetical protein
MGAPGAARGLARGLRVVALAWAILFTGAATRFADGYALTDPGWPVGFLLVGGRLAADADRRGATAGRGAAGAGSAGHASPPMIHRLVPSAAG